MVPQFNVAIGLPISIQAGTNTWSLDWPALAVVRCQKYPASIVVKPRAWISRKAGEYRGSHGIHAPLQARQIPMSRNYGMCGVEIYQLQLGSLISSG